MLRNRWFTLFAVLVLTASIVVFSPVLHVYAGVLHVFEGYLEYATYTTHTVYLTAGIPINIHMECPGGNIDPYFYLYDPSGAYLTYADDEGSQDCGGPWNDAILDFTPTVSGTYTIEAGDTGAGSASGNYVLTISTSAGGGRPIPASYELRTITCSVDVFDMPGGNPVSGARITGGQTWYVNPVPQEAADGSSWTKIYVSGTTDGYIPTRCVG